MVESKEVNNTIRTDQTDQARKVIVELYLSGYVGNFHVGKQQERTFQVRG